MFLPFFVLRIYECTNWCIVCNSFHTQIRTGLDYLNLVWILLGFSPSVCSGVIANVVKAKIPSSYHQGDSLEYFPAMIETTAAVHPGGSGGAVVNSEGQMIALVTRYSAKNKDQSIHIELCYNIAAFGLF